MATVLATTLLGSVDRSALSQLKAGLVIALALGAVAVFMSRGLGGPLAKSPLLVAILLGLLIGNSFGCPESLRPGLIFTIRHVLRLAVALVGFRITVQAVANIGVGPFLIAAMGLAATCTFTAWVSRRCFGVDRELSYLLAAGSAVCGAAAVLAVAAVVKARPQQTTVAVTLVTLLGTLTLLLYPVGFTTGHLPGLHDSAYGVFIGATVYEVAQVVGASYAVSEVAGNTAVVVKLSKVLMLIPLLIILSLWLRRNDPDQGTTRLAVPWFVLAFVLVVCLNTLHIVPAQVVAAINEVDLFLLTVVMVALGLETRVGRLQELRWAARATYAAMLTLLFSASMGYGMVRAATSALAPLGGGPGLTQVYGGDTPFGSATVDGERLFTGIGCAKCHVPSLPVGDRRAYLYSDLLLHDMGPALDDKVVQGEAAGRDWRTAPLWGLGLRQRFLHDGRATTLRDAIVAHGGEAEIVRRRFLELSDAEKEALYLFLRAL